MNGKINLLISLLLSGIAVAQSSGAFTSTGAMTTARSGHTATLLNNGQVLIAGGGPNFNSPTATAELYDPTRGTFTPTGNMTTPRTGHTASLLPDGRVIIAGGYSSSGGTLTLLQPLKTAEIYDPATGIFTSTGDMIHARACSAATGLNNGQILLSGGVGPGFRVLDAEFYDPTVGSFADAGPYATFRIALETCQGAAASLLPDGRVLIVWEDTFAEIYDSKTGLFTPAGRSPELSYIDGVPTATLLMTGKVLVAGGGDDTGVHKSAELFDISTGSFTPTGGMSSAHAGHSATLLPNGTVLIAGGPFLSATTEVYDPVSGTFRTGPQMRTGRLGHTATLLNDGRVLIAGGEASSLLASEGPSSLAELYTPDVLIPAPVLFSAAGDGQAQGAILHAGTARLVTASDPAAAGEAVEIYCAGLAEGSAIPPQVAIGGRLASILYFGDAPGFGGLNQINVRVPDGVAPGPAVSVRVSYLGRISNEVTVGVR